MRVILFVALICLRVKVCGQSFQTYEQQVSGSNIKLTMIAVPAGTFSIGSKSILADADETPVKTVSLSAFWMGEHEITFAEWDAFFKDINLPQSKNIDGVTRPTPQYTDLTWGMGREPNKPANSMSQQAAIMYCKWLYSKTGIFFRLPTEAEWEYACKAGGQDELSFDAEQLKQQAYHAGNSGGKFHDVKSLKPNAWGFYDMLGNLSEWTLDQYAPNYYQTLAPADPATAPASKYPRTVRGGSYQDKAAEVRCSNRIPSDAKWNQRDPQIPKSRWWLTDGMFVGFRVVRPLKQPSASEVEAFYAQYLK